MREALQIPGSKYVYSQLLCVNLRFPCCWAASVALTSNLRLLDAVIAVLNFTSMSLSLLAPDSIEYFEDIEDWRHQRHQ